MSGRLDEIEREYRKRIAAVRVPDSFTEEARDVLLLVGIARAAQAYRNAEAESDRIGEWEPAREAAVVLDAALARLDATTTGESER